MKRLNRIWTPQIAGAAGLIAVAALNMGNQSCSQQTAAAAPRVLKMEVNSVGMKAQNMTMPNGEQVDFPAVASDLFLQQIMSSEHFVVTNPIDVTAPIAPASSATSSGLRAVAGVRSAAVPAATTVMKSDAEVLSAYGFLPKAASLQRALSLRAAGATEAAVAQSSASLPTCLYNAPQAILGGQVRGFAVTGGGGVSIGYGAGPAAIGGSVNYTGSQMEISARTDDPLSKQPLVIGDGISQQSKLSFAFAFPAGVNVGANFFYQTPLTTVIRSAMSSALSKVVSGYGKLQGQTKTWNDVWESRVLYDPVIADGDTNIAFRGGYRAAAQVGDTFSIYNLRYQWAGNACDSNLLYRIPTSIAPIAAATIVSVGDNVSVAKVTYLQDVRIEPGAQVKIKSLFVPAPAKPAAAAK